MANPEILNIFPENDSYNVSPKTFVSMDIVDSDGDLSINLIKIQIENNIVFDAGIFSENFIDYSSYYNTIISGKNGYHFNIINSKEDFTDVTVITVDAYDSLLNHKNARSSFVVGTNQMNTLYFSDGYDLKKIYVRELVGESQNAVRNAYSSFSFPATINHISGQIVDGSFYLIASFDDSFCIVKNENAIKFYSTGIKIKKAEMNYKGDVYALNETSNCIDVYYDAYNLLGLSKDYTYNLASTPAIFNGTITDLHLVSEQSTKCEKCSRLYVGTSKGATKMNLYDVAGRETEGISTTYSISSGLGDYTLIGGSVENVVSIYSDDEAGLFYVATDDGYGDGGVSQIYTTQTFEMSSFFGIKELINTSSSVIKSLFGKK